MSGLTPDVLLRAYSVGLFPMAENRDESTLYWIDPERRGILPLDAFHMPRSLRRKMRKGQFDVRCDTAFREVVDACAEPAEGRTETWINDEIVHLYCELHAMGRAHSIETWQDGKLAGGLYGVALGGAFFGESMFSRATDASKIALAHLVLRLRKSGFVLLDTQFVTPHLKQFGAIEISRSDYRDLLSRSLSFSAQFEPDVSEDEIGAFVQSTTQTS